MFHEQSPYSAKFGIRTLYSKRATLLATLGLASTGINRLHLSMGQCAIEVVFLCAGFEAKGGTALADYISGKNYAGLELRGDY
jgi:hypothetical protein